MRLVGVLLVLAACKDATPPPPPPPQHGSNHPPQLAGAKTFAAFCAPCHGDDATGYKADHAPSLINPTFLESATDSFLIDAIEQGRPGTSMAAYARSFGGRSMDARSSSSSRGSARTVRRRVSSRTSPRSAI